MTIHEARDMVEELLKRLGVSFDAVEIRDEDTHPRISIQTTESSTLIGNRGENLRALNHVMKRMAEASDGDEKKAQFILDVNGYQEKRIEEIRNHARLLAERARMFRYDVEMHPMNAYERMLVHALFADEPDINTVSTGEGKFRRVVIRYCGESQPEASSSTEPVVEGADERLSA